MVEEEGGYRVFEVTYLWPTSAFTRDGVGLVEGQVPVDPEPGVVLFVTEDAWAIESTRCGTTPGQHTDLAHEWLTDGPGGGRFEELLDARGEGFAQDTGDAEQVLPSFEVGLRLMMLDVLEDAEAEAADRPEAFEAEYPQILATAEALDATEQQLDAKQDELLLLTDPEEWERRQGPCEGCHVGEAGSAEEIEALGAQVEALRRQREVLHLKYPLFTRLARAAMFLEQPREEQAAWVAETTGGVLASIGQARGFLERGELELWTLPPLVDATLRAGGFHDPAMTERILARVAEAEWDETVCSVAMAALSIGLGLAAGAATGGMAYALGGAAIAVGVADASWQTGEYFEDLALSNAAENGDDALVSPEQLRGADYWLAVAWVSAVSRPAHLYRLNPTFVSR